MPETCDVTRILPSDEWPCSGPATAEIWHGYATPAIACGFHAAYFEREAIAGHDIRLQESGQWDNRFGTQPKGNRS